MLTEHEYQRFKKFVNHCQHQACVACCWEWMGPKGKGGYGRLYIRRQGKTQQLGAHRVAFELNTGESPGKMFCCHTCDNPGCCNPAHLFIGTCGDNNRDALRKGRKRSITLLMKYGEQHHAAKLTVNDVIAMRQLRQQQLSYGEIAKRFHVDKMTAYRAIKGLRWRHV